MLDDPFAALGLPTRAGLTDDDVRSAWRRIAAATHPDREDGGDPALFGRAAAAYAMLRTADGRGEALADHAEKPGAGTGGEPGRRTRHARGRGLRAAGAGTAGAAAISALAILAVGWTPASIGILAGALTCLVRAAWRAVDISGTWEDRLPYPAGYLPGPPPAAPAQERVECANGPDRSCQKRKRPAQTWR